MANSVSDAPWNFAESDYTPDQYARACLIDTGEGAPESKSRYLLPVREPSGELNRNGVHAAAERLDQTQGVAADKKANAARRLITLYHEIGDGPPPHLEAMAGEDAPHRSAVPETERLWISTFIKGGSPLEVRSGPPGTHSRKIGGYAAVFDRNSEDLGGFRERVMPTFFNKSKSDDWPGVVCRWNHKDDFLLGTTSSGHLVLTLDNIGLDYEVDLPRCREDVLEMAERRDLRHSSFAFQVYDEDWVAADGYPMRHLISGRLIDVAPVTSPAYPDATVGLRSLARFVGAPIEDVLKKSENNELRSFFVRTDNAGKPAPPKELKSGQAAYLEILARRPDDPIKAPDA
jgi:HK97 family phage prohead protease